MQAATTFWKPEPNIKKSDILPMEDKNMDVLVIWKNITKEGNLIEQRGKVFPVHSGLLKQKVSFVSV